MGSADLRSVLADAKVLVARGDPAPEAVTDLVLRILGAAAETPAVRESLRDVPAGRALLRFTDGSRAIEFQAGAGTLRAEAADPRGGGPRERAGGASERGFERWPKVDATAATWLGLLGGTLKPWLAFTRGLVVCRAGLTELRWLQQVAERLQRGYQQDPP